MLALLLLALAITVTAECPKYVQWAYDRHGPYSEGQYEFPFQRPSEECRTYSVPAVEETIQKRMTSVIGDPDLYRLFQNTWPNTVDTTVKWHGFSADNPEEEVCNCPIDCA